MFALKKYLTNKQAIINSNLRILVEDSENITGGRLIEAMIYSTMAGGKRIRPILCLASSEALGINQDEKILDACCAIELIHTYSLIHDDLPAMDDDELRRGKPTCHIQFDEATAILAGDALLTYAFDILSSIGCLYPDYGQKCLQMIQILSAAAGHKGMVKGQMLDLINEGEPVSLDELKNIHRLKTGALIQASVIFGAILGGGNTEQLQDLTNYADHIGLAFQVMDDILNIEGNPDLLGKSVGTDIQREKCTYPALLGVEKSKKFADELVNNALCAIKHFDNKADPLREIASYIINRNK